MREKQTSETGKMQEKQMTDKMIDRKNRDDTRLNEKEPDKSETEDKVRQD